MLKALSRKEHRALTVLEKIVQDQSMDGHYSRKIDWLARRLVIRCEKIYDMAIFDSINVSDEPNDGDLLKFE